MAWSLAFTGFPYTVALRTGNPAAVNSAFLIFFPFAFLTPSMLPRELMSGWLKNVAAWNPVTYLLEGMRSVLSEGWDIGALMKASAAILGLAIITFTMAFSFSCPKSSNGFNELPLDIDSSSGCALRYEL
jgi:ABC-2 type transport system permease protein